MAATLGIGIATGQDSDTEAPDGQERFGQDVRPLLAKYCYDCHNEEQRESGIRVDQLDGSLPERDLRLWEGIRAQLEDEAMPPQQEDQPSVAERTLMIRWIDRGIAMARSRPSEKNGSIRRLTVAQYRNTLSDLLGIQEDFSNVLPPDAVSKDGFVNHEQTMLLSPLVLESYFDIAERALDACIVDEHTRPAIQRFRMELGKSINDDPYPENLILGALSHLLPNQDFMVTEPAPTKPFEFDHKRMQTQFRFIEGYQGNDTVRGWRDYNSIDHAVFACLRGNDGYPKGNPYESVPQGLLLRPAIPNADLFGVSSTYGPMANFKVALRELPETGRFRITVHAAKYDDALMLDPGTPIAKPDADSIIIRNAAEPTTVQIPQHGVYQVDVYLNVATKDELQPDPPGELSLDIGERHFSGRLNHVPFLALRLPAGPLDVMAHFGGESALDRMVLTPLGKSNAIAEEFLKFENRRPRLGVHLGLRRDCGSTLAQVGDPQDVSSTEFRDYVFEGAIANYPDPDVEKNNVNYLAGLREIAVRSEFTDGRDMPRLLLRSVEFEGPYYESWPPATHRNLFIESQNRHQPSTYAREIIESFATRAYRRPITDAEADGLFAIWERAYSETSNFQTAIRDSLLATLTSPQFLFLIENSEDPEPEPLTEWELASKLSYFLWNSAPDERLLKLAAAENLHRNLQSETNRLIADPRFNRFIEEFVSQWLSLDKFDTVEIDPQRFPKLTNLMRKNLRQEPLQFVKYLIENNLPLSHLLQSDFIVANEVVADYYGLAGQTDDGFKFVAIKHGGETLGGVLTQAGILSGLSNGRESNPVKRGAWLARKIIAQPPADPPPNVPELEDNTQLTLRERLEKHRSVKGCVKCHSGIDPWGIPFEEFDAAGQFRTGADADGRSILPDETEVAGVGELKAYLVRDRMDQVAFSMLKHLASYATGRTLTYNETQFLREQGLSLKADRYRLRDMIQFVVGSKLFLEK